MRASALLVCLLALAVPVTTAHAANPIQVENAKTGTTAWQLTNPAMNHEIEGYASLASVNRGGQILLYVSTTDATYTMQVFRLGWYGGAGGRAVTGTIALTGIRQPMPTPDPTTGLVECNWTSPYTLTIPNDPSDPTNWASGVYLVLLTGDESGKQSYITFVVRDDARSSDLLFQSSVTTFQAYNGWGGKSLYPYNSPGGQATKVSFNRPYDASYGGGGAGEYFVANFNGPGWEYNMLRWLERQGDDVTYATDLDTHENGSLLLSHKAFLSVGHDEYWTWQMRQNVQAARDQGVSLGFFGSDTSFWQIRLEPSAVTGAADRTIVGYKESALSADPYALDGDPSNDYLVTTAFRNSPVNLPEAALVGVMYTEQVGINGDIQVTDASHWAFAGTGLQNGDVLPGLLGYEVDQIFPSSPSNVVDLARSYFSTTCCGTQYSDMTIYTAASGALVFATGANQWAWGLDDYNVPQLRTSRLSAAAQQITTNVLAKLIAPSSTLPLSVAFNTPSPGVTLTGTITVTAVASQGSGTGYSYTVTVDNTRIYAGTSGTFSWNTATVADGGHTLAATVTDSAGNTASTSESVLVSNSGPAGTLGVNITSPTSGTTVSGTSWATVWVSGTSGTSNTYTLSVGGTAVATTTTSSTGPVSIPWDTTRVANGAMTLTATVKDAAGNTGAGSVSLTVSNGGSSSPPPPPPPSGTLQVSITQPTSGTTVSGTDWAVVWVSGASGTSNTYTLSVGGTTVATAATSSTGPVSIPWNTALVPNGTETLTATVKDATGNTGASGVTVTVSNGGSSSPPPPPPSGTLQVSITQPTSGTTVSGTSWAVVWVSGTSGTSNTYTLSVGGTTVGTASTSSTGPVSIPWNTTLVADGTQTLTATVQDATGNTGATSVSVAVSNGGSSSSSSSSSSSTTSTGGLQVAVTQPTSGTSVSGTNWAVVWVSGTSGTSNTYTLSVAGAQVATTTTSSTGPVSIPWDTTRVANGSETLTATVKDASGNTGSTSITITVAN